MPCASTQVEELSASRLPDDTATMNSFFFYFLYCIPGNSIMFYGDWSEGSVLSGPFGDVLNSTCPPGALKKEKCSFPTKNKNKLYIKRGVTQKKVSLNLSKVGKNCTGVKG